MWSIAKFRQSMSTIIWILEKTLQTMITVLWEMCRRRRRVPSARRRPFSSNGTPNRAITWLFQLEIRRLISCRSLTPTRPSQRTKSKTRCPTKPACSPTRRRRACNYLQSSHSYTKRCRRRRTSFKLTESKNSSSLLVARTACECRPPTRLSSSKKRASRCWATLIYSKRCRTTLPWTSVTRSPWTSSTIVSEKRHQSSK